MLAGQLLSLVTFPSNKVSHKYMINFIIAVNLIYTEQRRMIVGKLTQEEIDYIEENIAPME